MIWAWPGASVLCSPFGNRVYRISVEACIQQRIEEQLKVESREKINVTDRIGMESSIGRYCRKRSSIDTPPQRKLSGVQCSAVSAVLEAREVEREDAG